MHNTENSKVTLPYTSPILPYLCWCMLSCCMACYFLFPCYLFSSSCFLFSPLFLLLVVPCVLIPHLALCFAFLLQVVCLLLGWICVRLQYEVFSYRTYCFYAKHLNCELKFTYQLKTKDVAILTLESQEKMKSCIFLTFLVKIFSHIYLKLAF